MSNALLKIILKAKDEAYLIDDWIAHHAAIVGHENIIILDCGSTNLEFLDKLSRHAQRVRVVRYDQYYDDAHWIHANRTLYEEIAQSSKYATLLDADEFLIGRDGDFFSGRLVAPILHRYDLPYHCGTWVYPGDTECGFDTSTHSLSHGAHAGKAIARSDVLLDIGYLGHNFGMAKAARFATPESLGRIIVLHAKNLPPAVTQGRILNHLVSKGLVAQSEREKQLTQITALMSKPELEPLARLYARTYLENESRLSQQNGDLALQVPLIGDHEPLSIPSLSNALDAVNFPAWLKNQQERMEIAEL